MDGFVDLILGAMKSIFPAPSSADDINLRVWRAGKFSSAGFYVLTERYMELYSYVVSALTNPKFYAENSTVSQRPIFEPSRNHCDVGPHGVGQKICSTGEDTPLEYLTTLGGAIYGAETIPKDACTLENVATLNATRPSTD